MTWQQMTPGPPSRGMSHPRQRRGTGAAKGTRCLGHPNTCQEHKHRSLSDVRATFCVWPGGLTASSQLSLQLVLCQPRPWALCLDRSRSPAQPGPGVHTAFQDADRGRTVPEVSPAGAA